MSKTATISKIAALISAQSPEWSLAQSFYKDADIYQAELENLFLKHWLFAGHISQIPACGDYILCEFDTESIIVVRTEAGDVKAHLNLCRHRGSKICLDSQGTKTHFVCPYHAWAYALDGTLVSAGEMPKDFDPVESGLRSVDVKIVGGFILVSLAEKPLSLTNMTSNLETIWSVFDTENLKVAKVISYPIAANWKLAIENYQECYHCAPSHKEYSRIHAMARPAAEYDKLKSAFKRSIPSSGIANEFNAYFDNASSGEEGFQYARNPLLEGKLTGSKDGKPVAPLLGTLTEYMGGASELMLGPFMYFLIYDDYMIGYRFRPSTQDDCVCDQYWFVRGDAQAKTDYDVDELIWLWDLTTRADQEIIKNNQKGVNSRFYRPGRLSDKEYFLQSFLKWYLASLI